MTNTIARINPAVQGVRIDPESLAQQNMLRRERGQPLLHQCSVCGCCGEWGPTWTLYGSYRDQDEGHAAIFCSGQCMTKEPVEVVLSRCRRGLKAGPGRR